VPAPSVEQFLPLTPPLFQVLVSLADEDRHGYAILKEVEERSGGTIRLSTGTLYGIIKRLLADGWIAEVRTRRPADDDERRRYYRLTPLGRDVALAETARLERAAAQARATLRLRRIQTT
jgi:DNA-binding PadR family transcriptional regulator